MKSILILCGGHPFICDDGFGHHVANRLLKMDLPENVTCMDCGYSASEFDDVIEGKDKMIFVDIFRTKDQPGTIVRFKPEEVPLTVEGVTDVPKLHLIELLDHIAMSGKCPETVFIGVVPKDADTMSEQLTPEIESKIPEIIDLVMEEVNKPL